MLDEIATKTENKDQKGDRNKEKELRLSEIKPVNNITKNLQSFLEINPMQKAGVEIKLGMYL